ncbi:glycosyltransferase family 8 protein [Latilactobacillus sakei]|uniref:glycosyltransferase family 8 protein n=1 Tax=Latilactobacillus sakei TaxID=1599 RepID=UPI001F51741E|nr:glycosyltransferase family 8 protein [Latilactobacillus sakei]
MMTINTIAIMVAADEQYADQLLLTLKSIREHCPLETAVDLFVLSSHLSPTTKSAVARLLALPHHVSFIAINPRRIKNFPGNNHFDQTAYYRILAPQILLAKHIERVLYLDLDTLIRTDLTPLYNSDLENNIIGAVIDPGKALTLKRLGVPQSQANNIYFNAGVLLIDTVLWERHHISQKILAMMVPYPGRRVNDIQDTLNVVLAGRAKLLAPQWNVQNTILFKTYEPINNEYRQLFKQVIKAPKIIHFTTEKKPWEVFLNHPYMPEYQTYLAQLPADKRDQINIVSAANSNFVEPLAILYASILNNNDDNRHYAFYVLSDQLTARDQATLRQITARFNAELTFIEVDETPLTTVIQNQQILKTAYYRLLIPNLLPEIERVLYLDCDTLCLANLARLWDIELGNTPLAAVEDASFQNRLAQMSISYKSIRYFNAGVLLMNLAVWRQQKLTEQILAFIKEHPQKLKFHAQDALNAILHDRWIHLHPKWNVQSNILMDFIIAPTERINRQFMSAQKDPGLIHFCGSEKPWDKSSTHPYTPQYRFYKSRFLENNGPVPFKPNTGFGEHHF